MSVVLHIEHLSIGYATKAGQKVVQHNLCLQAQEGELICLLGQNGCGKSTLLRTLCNLQPALGGKHNMSNCSASEMAERMALVLTDRIQIDQATVRDVVAIGRYPYTNMLGHLTEEDEHIIDLAMHDVGINPEQALRLINELSDGEKQRALIAKALAQQTPIILLDEPTAHLDLPSRIKTMNLLRELAHSQHKCILLSTHELELALRTADTIWLMTDKGINTGKADSMKEKIIEAFELQEYFDK